MISKSSRNNTTELKKNTHNKICANEDISSLEVFVISHEGKNLGKMPTAEARSNARSYNLDLVIVGEREGVPVVKYLNLNKEMYEKKKKEKIAKKNQHEVQMKELRISIRIGLHDLSIKTKQAIKFLLDGNRVKFVLVMRGREKDARKTIGVEIFQKVVDEITEGVKISNKIVILEQDNETFTGWAKVFFLKK